MIRKLCTRNVLKVVHDSFLLLNPDMNLKCIHTSHERNMSHLMTWWNVKRKRKKVSSVPVQTFTNNLCICIKWWKSLWKAFRLLLMASCYHSRRKPFHRYYLLNEWFAARITLVKKRVHKEQKRGTKSVMWRTSFTKEFLQCILHKLKRD